MEVPSRASEAGLYVFPRLPVGVYDITAEKTGFKKVDHTGIQIRIPTRQEPDIRLEVGDIQQVVSVTAEAPLLQTTSSRRG